MIKEKKSKKKQNYLVQSESIDQEDESLDKEDEGEGEDDTKDLVDAKDK